MGLGAGAGVQFLSQLGHCVGAWAVVLFGGGCCQVLDAGGGVLGGCVVCGAGVDCHVLGGGGVLGGCVVCGVGVDCQVLCGGGVLCGVGATGGVPVPP
ncbi:hypothetical protein A5652_25785 [Mycobacterium sp. 1165178.9]|nr:hypothetical protein A5652_25785 [Mycobacterium sp. 1165178.9]